MTDWVAKVIVTLGLCALAMWGFVVACHGLAELIRRQAVILGPLP